MDSFLKDINNFDSKKLSSVETVVKTQTGEVFVEKRLENGEVKIEKKEGEHAGFVIDLTPDLKVGILVENKICISSQDVPRDLHLIQEQGITHVLNLCSHASFHTDVIKFLAVVCYDTPEFKIHDFFDKCFVFIDNALSTGNNNKVLIHCNAGKSRSVTVGLAYLMRTQGIKWRESLEHLKKTRPQAHPNEGFIKQLDEYQEQLKL